jgi:hypothetical protein
MFACVVGMGRRPPAAGSAATESREQIPNRGWRRRHTRRRDHFRGPKRLRIVTVAVAECGDAWATGYRSAIIGERCRADIEEQNRSVARSDRSRKPIQPARRNEVRGAATAQDGAATALNRILSRRCKPFESKELGDPTALAALGR